MQVENGEYAYQSIPVNISPIGILDSDLKQHIVNSVQNSPCGKLLYFVLTD